MMPIKESTICAKNNIGPHRTCLRLVQYSNPNNDKEGGEKE